VALKITLEDKLLPELDFGDYRLSYFVMPAVSVSSGPWMLVRIVFVRKLL
jgi:hypothetical protein